MRIGITFGIIGLVLTTASPVYSGQTYNPFTGRLDFCSTVQEEDSSPSAAACQTVKVSNGTFTDNGDGTFSLSITGGGAPSDAEYVVTEANASLSAEVAPSAANQVPNSTSSTAGSWTATPTLDTLDTGQGANELYDMDQNVLTTSAVTFDDITTSSTTPCIVWTDTNGDDFEACVDGNQLLVSNLTNGSVYLILTSGSIFLPGFVNCNLDTDGFGKLTCGSDAGGGGNSFETIAVPAGTNPVADSATDTLTFTETSFLTITGDSGTDTIDITQVTTDLGTDGLIALNAVALGTDTTNDYVATVADGTGVDGSTTGETATYTPTLDFTEINSLTWGAGAFTTMTFDAGATDPVFTAGSGTFTIAPGGSDLIISDDMELQDASPFLRLTDTTASEDDYEWWADANSVGLSNVTDGIQLIGFNGGNRVTFIQGQEHNVCKTYENLVAADDNLLLLADNESITVEGTYCLVTGFTTLPTLSFEDELGNALTGAPTCTTLRADYAVMSGANATLYRGEGLRFDTTNTPAPVIGTQALICVSYVENG